MKILFPQYFKFTQAVLAIFMVAHLASEPMPLASNKEIVIFREMKKHEIYNAKTRIGTNLDVVGALAVVEDDFDNHRVDPITFSRYALGMMIGNGYPDGVTTGLKASVDERAIIERVVSKAAAHSRDLRFFADQIWSANPSPRATNQHVDTLNRLSLVAPAEPYFEFAPKITEHYKDLDSILHEICASFAGTPAAELMYQAQLSLADPHTKSFILTFSSLSNFEQAEIIDVFNESKASNDFDYEVGQAFVYIKTFCDTIEKAKDFIKNIEERVLTPVIHLIGVIPAGPISKLDHIGSELAQRNALRAFFGVLENPDFSAIKKEICLNALFGKLNPLIPAAAKEIVPVIQGYIKAIDINPKISGNIERAIQKALKPGKIAALENVPLQTCLTAIANLGDVHRDIHYNALIDKIRMMVPNIPPSADERAIRTAFNKAHEQLINRIINNRIDAVTPPRELISPNPVVLPILDHDYVTEVDNLAAIQAIAGQPALDEKVANFEDRLKNFLVAHWTTNYKPAGFPVNFVPVRNALQNRFDEINDLNPSFVIRRILKVKLIETILHNLAKEHVPRTIAGLLACIPIDEDTLQELLIDPNHVYTSMDKIREFSSIDRDAIFENHVFNVHPGLRKGPAETDQAYWQRIGDYCIGVYNAKIKPHIYPVGLQGSLTANADVGLVSLSAMFYDVNDSIYAINLGEGAVPDFDNAGLMAAREEIRAFQITAVGLQTKLPQFKLDLEQSYKSVHDHFTKSLVRLFGTAHVVEPGLLWDSWVPDQADFTPERIALCKSAFLIFAYFDRAGNHYEDDAARIAEIAGRFTHCPDGKKTVLEEVSSYAANEFLGDLAVADAGVEVEYTLADFLKKEIFKDFKKTTITALSDHPGEAENVSITAAIKQLNRAFWDVPTDIEAAQQYFFAWDYYSVGNGFAGTNAVLQYFYQHIYAGPHELVNVIYKYLLTADAHKRENFLGLVGQMLSTCRPFADWVEDGIDCRELVRERYCSAADPTMFTRKGIETILFYAGYLAWNGPDYEHPLIADWHESLDWLRASDADAYSKIYTH
ncbi:MAG: hypothetical protein WCJ92_06445 [Alphaproteobacteria bacterium]